MNNKQTNKKTGFDNERNLLLQKQIRLKTYKKISTDLLLLVGQSDVTTEMSTGWFPVRK